MNVYKILWYIFIGLFTIAFITWIVLIAIEQTREKFIYVYALVAVLVLSCCVQIFAILSEGG